MPVNKIDLNSDVGESFGNYKLGLDEEVVPLISSANVACGFHAGDPTVMKRTLEIAADNGVAVLMDRIREGLDWMEPKVRHLGVGLGLETAGKVSQFGSLGDIAVLAQVDRVVPGGDGWRFSAVPTRRCS